MSAMSVGASRAGGAPARHRSHAGAIRATTTLRAQVAAVRLELDGLRRRVEVLQDADSTLYERFHSVLEQQLDARISELGGLAARRGVATKKRWQDFAELKARCDGLLAETHDFVQGALIRREALDDGLCAIADRLLDGLSDRANIAWGRLTVPADGEFVSDLAQIVRLRAADVSVWHLPVAVHEFGHFIGPRIERDGARPFAELLALEPVGSMAWSHAHELFADAFATYAGGPAYPAACVISRFDPGDAASPTQSHPAHVDRVFLMARILEAMDATSRNGEFRWLLEHLRATWQANLAEAGRSWDVPSADVERLTALADSHFMLLEAGVPRTRYTSMDRARRAEDVILGRVAGDLPGVTVADVLNGAWLSRIDQPVSDMPALRLRGANALRLASGAPA